MESWYRSATVLEFKTKGGGNYTGGPFRGVIHTTQGFHLPTATEYKDGGSAPHFTLVMQKSEPRLYQHFPIDVASCALKRSNLVATNQRSAIQIEIAWKSEEIDKLPESTFKELYYLMYWIELETGLQNHGTGTKFCGVEAYGNDKKTRMTADQWNAFNGWCGHQHVPGNHHWDPGPLDIDKLLAGVLSVSYKWSCGALPKPAGLIPPAQPTYLQGF